MAIAKAGARCPVGALDNFFDIYTASLNKKGEELCGDTVKFVKTDRHITIVLSDGLGSGVKANILATLTAEILITMLEADIALEEVLKTIVATLPICQTRKIAYSTFSIVRVDRSTGRFRIFNFDNPPFLYLRRGQIERLETTTEIILDRKIKVAAGTLERGDFLGLFSDGVLYAGMGVQLNFGWGWDNIASYVEGILKRPAHNARAIVQSVLRETHQLYGGQVGDDATLVGLYVRQRNPLMIFTGPPLDRERDEAFVERSIEFVGRKVVCGGTTGNIVATYLGETIDIDLSTIRPDLPPIGTLSCIDLVTEGILTLNKATEYLKNCHCDLSKLQFDNNGAYLLAREILQADSIFFLVGQRINEFYQNPLLPKHISIRRSLIEELVQLLRAHQKEVTVEYC